MPEPEIQVEKIPWEERKEIGFLKALRLTLKEIIFHPIRFFSKMANEEEFGNPFFFAVIMLCMSSVIALVCEFVFIKFLLSIGQHGKSQTFSSLIYVLSFLLIFISGVIRFLITCGIVHLGFVIAGARKGFRATFRVIAYTRAVEVFALLIFLLALSVLAAAPLMPSSYSYIIIRVLLMFGTFLIALYPLLFYFVGLKRAHNLGVMQTLCGFILPIALSIAAFRLLPKDSPGGVCPLRQTQATQSADKNVQDTKAVTEKSPETK